MRRWLPGLCSWPGCATEPCCGSARRSRKRLLRPRKRLTPEMMENIRARLGLVSTASAPFLMATQDRVQRQQRQAERSKRSRSKENAGRATLLASLPHKSEKNNKMKRRKQCRKPQDRRVWSPGRTVGVPSARSRRGQLRRRRLPCPPLPQSPRRHRTGCPAAAPTSASTARAC